MQRAVEEGQNFEGPEFEYEEGTYVPEEGGADVEADVNAPSTLE
jgi:hypothetical protein